MRCSRLSAIRRLTALYLERLLADEDFGLRVSLSDALCDENVEVVRKLDAASRIATPRTFTSEAWAMNTFEIAIAIFGLVLLAWAVTGTKETAGARLLGIVISLIALTVAALAAIVFHGEGRR